jgi:hypothetical protein
VPRARKFFNVNNLERNRVDLILLDHGLLPATPEQKTPALVAKANVIVEEEQRKVFEKQLQAQAEENRRQQAWNAAHPQIAACRTSCAQAVSECHNRNLGMNWGSIFGGYHESELDCGGFSSRCFARCN